VTIIVSGAGSHQPSIAVFFIVKNMQNEIENIL